LKITLEGNFGLLSSVFRLKSFKMNNIKRLLEYIKPYKPLVLGNIVANILMAVFTIVSIPAIIPFLEILFDRTPKFSAAPEWAWNISSLVDYGKYAFFQLIETEGKEYALACICLLIVVIFFFKNLFRYLSLFFMAPVRNGIVRDIRQQLFSKMMHLPLSYFSDERKGDLMSRITADVQEVEWSILNVLEVIFREPLIIFGCLLVMLYISPALTIFVFILFLFTALIIGGIGKTLRKKSSVAQEKLGNLVSIIEEGLSGLRIIKGFTAEGYQEDKFERENNSYRNTLTQLLRRRDLSSPLSEFLGIAVVAVLLWYGSRLVFGGEMEAENFFAFIFAFFNIITPAKSFSNAFYNIQKGLAAVDRIDGIQNASIKIADLPDALSIKSFEKEIEYRNVSFIYDNGHLNVLKNIQLHIPKGKVVALVGPSGSGKTTLADLLPRLFEVTKGQLLIDGKDIRAYTLESLRALFGIVSQEPILFNDTIYNNIAFGKKGIDEAAIINAARIANAHDFIVEMENGYQTNIGDRGDKLSGGQRQRITIARAVLKNPPILILDEATSSLDSESERLVQEALSKLMANRTSIVIAHRLSTIQHADDIIVMQEGQILERGTHLELLRAGGAYKKLVDLQGIS